MQLNSMLLVNMQNIKKKKDERKEEIKKLGNQLHRVVKISCHILLDTIIMPHISKQGHGLDVWNVTSNLDRFSRFSLRFFFSKVRLFK